MVLVLITMKENEICKEFVKSQHAYLTRLLKEQGPLEKPSNFNMNPSVIIMGIWVTSV